MRLISKKYLKEKSESFPEASVALATWEYDVKQADWTSSQDVKRSFNSVSIINNKRAVFNIKGNQYRLVVDIEYTYKIVFIVWFGTHKAYDKINVETLNYEKQNTTH
jgi:mRNA interferase HigB